MAKKDDIGIVVDDQDTVVAHKKYTEMSPDERRRITCIFIYNDAGELLIQRRALHKKIAPGYWGPSVTGGVESHESYEENAYKELEEELGLTGVDLKFVGSFPFDLPSHNEMAGIFTAKWDGDISTITIQESEVDSVQWINEEDLTMWLNDETHTFVDSMKLYLDVLKKS